MKNEYPTTQEIAEGWKKYLPTFETIHKTFNRPIIFTEIGYKSTADSTVDPWKWIDDIAINELPISKETQANCYAAFFDTVWEKDWFAGVHIWKLSDYYWERAASEKDELDFGPLGKPAEQVIIKGFQSE